MRLQYTIKVWYNMLEANEIIRVCAPIVSQSGNLIYDAGLSDAHTSLGSAFVVCGLRR